MKTPWQSAGGKAAAPIRRAQAERAYYLNPSVCKYCGEVIHPQPGVKIQRARRKKYCNWTCASKFNKKAAPNAPKEESVTIVCDHCGNPHVYTKRHTGQNRKYCLPCRSVVMVVSQGKGLFDPEITKKELFEKAQSWQSARSRIQRHARVSFILSGRPLACHQCGYDKHVDIAHIKAVSDFDGGAKISEINSPQNLVGLCPNHHWEFDSKLLVLA